MNKTKDILSFMKKKIIALYNSSVKWIKSPKGKNILFEIIRTAVAIGVSFAIAAIIIFVTSDQPVEAIKVFITAPFSSDYTLGKVFTESVPLIFSGIAVCIIIRCGQFNMIGEGAFYIGGLMGAVVAINFPLPAIVLPVVAMLVAGTITGIIGYIPAKLKASLQVNEFVSSIMFNFILFWLGMYLLANTFLDPNYSDLATKLIPEGGKLPFLSFENDISTSLIVALIFALLAWVFLFKTKWGYAIRMTGENKNFATYSGIKSKSAIVYSQVIGAGISGFGGAAFVLGNYYRFNWKALPGYGFDGFIIAIIARNNPLLVPIAALFFGYLRTGAMEMARLTDVTSEVVFIIQAIMILLIGADAFLSSLKRRSIKKAALNENVVEGGVK